jgi:hypothetical protein
MQLLLLLVPFLQLPSSRSENLSKNGAVVMQAKALMDLQKRFVQQERQLQASMASAAGSNASAGADVEPYFPKERVQLEQDMLHKVGQGRLLVNGAAAYYHCS